MAVFPRGSLLYWSGRQRFVLALFLVAILWFAVIWALI